MPTTRCRNFLNKLPDDEPAFTIRARDPLILDAINAWVKGAKDAGVPVAKIEHVLAILETEIKPWQETHKTKLPD